MSRKTTVLVIGGGKDARSRSQTDLAPLLGRPSAGFVLEAVASLDPETVVLLYPETNRDTGEAVLDWAGRMRKKLPIACSWIKAEPRAGVEDILPVLRAAVPGVKRKRDRDVLLIPAGRNIVTSRTLKTMLAAHRKRECALTLLTPADGGADFAAALFRIEDFVPLIPVLSDGRRGKACEILTRLFGGRGGRVGIYEPPPSDGILPLTGPDDLARASAVLRSRKNRSLAGRGVRFLDPQTAWVDWDAVVGPGTLVYPSVFIEGPTRIGRDCRIYPHVHIINSRIGDRARILDCTVIEDSILEKGAQAGPFSRLRPKTILRAGSRVGNFVEMKNTDFGPGSKAQHLSYLGDTLVEEKVNVGAGTITCNYDGVRKSRTHIEAGAFIGSGTELIAPVRVGKGAYIAAGSTITKDVSPGSLALARTRQEEKPGWVLEKIRDRKKK